MRGILPVSPSPPILSQSLTLNQWLEQAGTMQQEVYFVACVRTSRQGWCVIRRGAAKFSNPWQAWTIPLNHSHGDLRLTGEERPPYGFAQRST